MTERVPGHDRWLDPPESVEVCCIDGCGKDAQYSYGAFDDVDYYCGEHYGLHLINHIADKAPHIYAVRRALTVEDYYWFGLSFKEALWAEGQNE